MNPNATATSNPQKQRMPGVTRLQRLTALEPVQIDPRIQLEISKLDLSNQTFKDCLRDLEYLKGLQKYSSYNSNASIVELKPEMCPVDHGTQKWGFLPCSHFFCANCYSETDNFDFECSICSTKFAKQAIRFIDMQRWVFSFYFKIRLTCIVVFIVAPSTPWRTYRHGRFPMKQSGELRSRRLKESSGRCWAYEEVIRMKRHSSFARWARAPNHSSRKLLKLNSILFYFS